LDVSAGIMHVHSKHVLHRDISGRNCLVDNYWRAYVSDFGLSQSVDPDKDGGAFTHDEMSLLPVRWCAPETLTRRHNSKQSDVYMFAMFMTEVISRQIPYQRCNAFITDESELLLSIVWGQLRPVIPDWCPNELATLMQSAWLHEPAERLTMTQINSRLEEYLSQCLQAKKFSEVYHPFKSSLDVHESAQVQYSLEEEMAASAAYTRIKKSHYMSEYQSVKEESKSPSRHVHSAACHPLPFGLTSSPPPPPSLSTSAASSSSDSGSNGAASSSAQLMLMVESAVFAMRADLTREIRHELQQEMTQRFAELQGAAEHELQRLQQRIVELEQQHAQPPSRPQT